MAEAQAKSDGPHDPRKPHAAHFAPPAPPEIQAPKNVPIVIGSAAASDDSPTIISRGRQGALRLEDALAGMLRGRRLAHYELLEPIGVGGMAAVIRGRDTQLDRLVALKILPPDMAADSENVRRFHQEARAAAKLDHENIARVFFCGEDQGLHFIAFEFVEGDNLRTLIEQRGRVPVPEAIHYLLQIATGLAHAAARGVVHRDIKPSNIIISSNGRAKLVDMGLARSLEPQTDEGLTQSGVTLGTFDYISPEQALEPREADVRSDIYSLGCTLYHMLTGQPPVPEGTAAKKLHHHQNVDPADPRQLNPAIPDEVAALLARMMAKDPWQRYQRPEELVGHLIALAQKLGGADRGTDSVLFVDAPLPGQPRTRPLLIAVSAVVALLALIAVLSPWPPPAPRGGPETTRTQPIVELRKSETGPSSSAANGNENVPVVSRAKEPATITTHDARELASFLQRQDPVVRVYLNGDLYVSRETPLLFQGQELTIEPDKRLEELPTIFLRADAPAGEEFWAALTLRGGNATIRRVRFEFDSGTTETGRMTAVAQQAGRLTLDNCLFAQEEPSGSVPGRWSSLTINGPATGAERPLLVLQDCYFARGQVALTVGRAAEVRVRQCAFGPHRAALFDLLGDRGGSTAPSTTLRLQNCSAFVVGDSVFRLEEGSAGQLSVDNCVFSCPENDTWPHGQVSLIEQMGSKAGKWSYASAQSCYHNLKTLWTRSPHQGLADSVTDWSRLQQRFEVTGDHPLELTSSPWENPRPLQAARNEEPKSAFRLKTDVAELRQRDHPAQLIGVEHCVWGRSYKEKLPLFDEKKPADTVARLDERTVDPSVAAPKDNVYRTLRQALEDTKPGEVILIKHQGLLQVEPVRLEKAGVDVVVKPYPGYHPLLSIGATTEPEAALFRIYDGQLRLEGLEFQLAPGGSPFKSQTIVAIMGDGQCSVKNCLITFAGSKEAPLSLVTLADSAGVMRMEPQPGPQQDPRLTIEGCLARGIGNLVVVRASRPFDLHLEHSLAALDGSLLVIDGNPREGSIRGRTQLTLEQVTTYLTDHLLWLRALPDDGRSTKGLVPTQIKSATNCLFVSASGKSLVHVEGVDTEAQMQRLFSWSDSGHNFYSNFALSLLDQQPTGSSDAMPPPPYGKTQWETFTGEQDGRFERLRLNTPLPADLPLTKVTAIDFKAKPEANLQGYGVDLDTLPKPWENSSSHDATP